MRLSSRAYVRPIDKMLNLAMPPRTLYSSLRRRSLCCKIVLASGMCVPLATTAQSPQAMLRHARQQQQSAPQQQQQQPASAPRQPAAPPQTAPVASAPQPQQAVAPTPPIAPPEVLPPATTPPHHAEVAFANGQLTVRADNSSLHQILGSIAHITGMTITGGVEDQRVFGSYGPGDASTILATLLDGTGVNMLIREGDAHQPTELILTPRSGGSAPPITAQDAEIGNDQPVPPSQSNVRELAPGQSMPLPSESASPSPTAETPAQNNTGAASGGALTPDQVYQKILEMQKARAGASTNNPPTSGANPGAGTPQ